MASARRRPEARGYRPCPNASARGGVGGNGAYYSFFTGAGGGGAGGSVLLRTTKGFNVSNAAAAFDVSGGAGGTQYSVNGWPRGPGGNGGKGFLRLEDSNGGLAVPGGTQGTYSPVGAGLPSVVYTKWLDLGVQDPRILPWANSDVPTTTTNDAIYVQAQMTKEHPTKFGTPDTSAIKISDQTTTNLTITSAWTSVKLHDKTGVIGGAFTPSLGAIPGLPPTAPDEFSGFDISGLNGHGYRFIRFRVYFQLDATQGVASPVPSVDRITTNFLFNF